MKNKWGMASLICGILSIVFIVLSIVIIVRLGKWITYGVVLGVSFILITSIIAIVGYFVQRKINKDKLSLIGLILGLISLVVVCSFLLYLAYFRSIFVPELIYNP